MKTRPSPSEPAHHTTVTRLTPAGRGAIATLAIEGAGAMEAVGELFRPITGKPLAASPVDRIRFGIWHHDTGDQEEIVVCRRAASNVEIHCHGGDAAAAAIIAALVSRGVVLGDEATWLHRRHRDPQLEFVWRRLSEARTQRTAGILLDQLHGAWPKALRQIAESLEVNGRDLASGHLQHLIDLVPLGRHLTIPWKIVVVGLPNVGKSSLVNTMLGFSRCIVFDQPGTTRDIVATHTALDGWPIELMDTAGIRDGQNAIEATGVELALSEVAAADLVVHVCDATRPDASLVDPAIARHPNVLTVENKSDLVDKPMQSSDIRTSAVTGAGVDRLIELIVHRLVPNSPTAGDAVPIGNVQIQLLADVQASINRGDIQRAVAILAQHHGG
ncbi:MAG: 50S ribosome-binding GTPase [Pirellulaceae bacterium]|nr:50S ribosome-binding GTPase [Pirellulaceae bacterium]MDP6718643.1 50S ribosome-binding GTPase [Pirellulaceae bacterium]